MCLHVSTEPSYHVLHGVMSGSVDGLYFTRSDFAKCHARKLGYISSYKMKLPCKRSELDEIDLLKYFLFLVRFPSP